MSSSASTSPSPGADAFLDSLLSMVNNEDMVAILKAQSQMLDRFEKTNEMLSNFNRLSAKRYEMTLEQFREHTDTLLTMKKDLDSVFRRIRTLKKKLATDYPQAFVAALEDIVPPDLDEEEETSPQQQSGPAREQPPHPANPLKQEQHQQHPQHNQQHAQQQHQQHPPQREQQHLPQASTTDSNTMQSKASSSSSESDSSSDQADPGLDLPKDKD